MSCEAQTCTIAKSLKKMIKKTSENGHSDLVLIVCAGALYMVNMISYTIKENYQNGFHLTTAGQND